MSSEDKKLTEELARILKKQKAMLEEFEDPLNLTNLDPKTILSTPVERFTNSSTIKLQAYLKEFPSLRVFGRYQDTGTPLLSVCFSRDRDFDSQLAEIQPWIEHLPMIPEVISAPLKINARHLKIGEPGTSNLALVFPEHKPEEIWLIDDEALVSQILYRWTNPKEALQYLYKNFSI